MPLLMLEIFMLALALVLVVIVLRLFGKVASLRPLARMPVIAGRWIMGWVKQQIKEWRAHRKARRQMTVNLTADEGQSGRRRTLQAVKDGGGDQAWAERLQDQHFATQVQHRLEVSFDLFERERISLETYQSLLFAELEATRRHMADLRIGMLHGQIDPSDGEADLAEGQELLNAVEWCIGWANSYAAQIGGAEGDSAVEAPSGAREPARITV